MGAGSLRSTSIFSVHPVVVGPGAGHGQGEPEPVGLGAQLLAVRADGLHGARIRGPRHEEIDAERPRGQSRVRTSCSRMPRALRYPAARNPRPPALLTAATSSGVEAPPAMGDWTIGTDNSSRQKTCGLLRGVEACGGCGARCLHELCDAYTEPGVAFRQESVSHQTAAGPAVRAPPPPDRARVALFANGSNSSPPYAGRAPSRTARCAAARTRGPASWRSARRRTGRPDTVLLC